MQITVYPNYPATTGLVVLAYAGGLRGQPHTDGFDIGENRKVQISESIRGNSARPISRQNRTTEISFRVYGLFSSVAAAESFLLQYGVAVPDGGTVSFMTESDGPQQTLWLPNAVIKVTRSQSMGETTMHQINMIGSEIQAAKP